MVINEAMARALWPGQDPLGKRIGFRGSNPNWREVVGVVGDITFPSFGALSSIDTEFQTYQPLAQTGLDHGVSAVRLAHDLLILPLAQQQVDRVGIQLFALLWQAAATPGMQ